MVYWCLECRYYVFCWYLLFKYLVDIDFVYLIKDIIFVQVFMVECLVNVFIYEYQGL